MTRPSRYASCGVAAVVGACALACGARGKDAGAPAVAAAAPVAPREAAVVDTEGGMLRGAAAAGVLAFKGVRYAAPMDARGRFRPPAPLVRASGTVDATAFGPPCLQAKFGGGVTGQEDCLTLDVWTPSTSPPEPLPVLVFLHGGGNHSGSSSERVLGAHVYDGTELAARGRVVVVTLNYRLGALGFLAHPALDGDRRSGNWALLDQLAALGWVQRNVRAFGGDPARVTLFGQSAGAIDACALLASPRARGLFSRAGILSENCVAMPRADAVTVGEQLVAAVGCAGPSGVAECLRAKDAAAIASALVEAGVPARHGFQPAIDDDLVPRPPIDAIGAGEGAPVPVVFGTTSDEFRALVGLDVLPRPIATDDDYRAMLRADFGPTASAAIASEYPAASYPTPFAALVDVLTDSHFTCPARVFGRALAGRTGEAAYRYWFTHAFASGPLARAGAGHAMDLLFLFRPALEGQPFTDDERALSDAVIGYWSRFAATGDPNGGGAPAWPRYEVRTDPYLRVDTAIAPGAGVRTKHCDFWDALRP